MLSFEQYVNEAYSFRLGGSQNKGYDQNEVKTFGELVRGDDLYIGYKDKILVCTFLELRNDKENQIKFTYDGHSTESFSFTLMKNYEQLVDATIDILDNFTQQYVCTNAEEIVEKVNKKYDTHFKVEDIRDRRAKIKESYSFRLGGSQKKGFNQSIPFGNLKIGEAIFLWNSDTNNNAVEMTVKKIVEVEDSFRFFYAAGDYDYIFVPKDAMSKAVAFKHAKSLSWAIATSYEDLANSVKEEFNVDLNGVEKYEDR